MDYSSWAQVNRLSCAVFLLSNYLQLLHWNFPHKLLPLLCVCVCVCLCLVLILPLWDFQCNSIYISSLESPVVINRNYSPVDVYGITGSVYFSVAYPIMLPMHFRCFYFCYYCWIHARGRIAVDYHPCCGGINNVISGSSERNQRHAFGIFICFISCRVHQSFTSFQLLGQNTASSMCFRSAKLCVFRKWCWIIPLVIQDR